MGQRWENQDLNYGINILGETELLKTIMNL